MTAARPLRVALVCDHLAYEDKLHGAGRMLVELLAALRASGADATACVLRAPGKLGAQLQRDGLPITFFDDAPASPATFAKLLRHVRRHRVEVLHVTDYGASFFGRLVGLVARIPVVVHVRSHHSKHQRRGFPPHIALMYRALAPSTARALAVSRSVREFAIAHMGFRPERVEVWNNPLARTSFGAVTPAAVETLRREYRLEPSTPVVGSVTQFYPAKGIHVLVAAFAEVVRRLPHARLLLVGDGPERAALEAQARELGIADLVIFAGFRSDVEDHLALFGVAAVPSLEEGFGNVAVEALAAGLPVVASRVGGLPEIVDEGAAGFLVDPEQPAQLADALVRILGDSALRERMAGAALRAVDRFSLPRYVERLHALYREVLSERHARPTPR